MISLDNLTLKEAYAKDKILQIRIQQLKNAKKKIGNRKRQIAAQLRKEFRRKSLVGLLSKLREQAQKIEQLEKAVNPQPTDGPKWTGH